MGQIKKKKREMHLRILYFKINRNGMDQNACFELKKKKKLHVSIKMCILIEYYIPVDKSRILEKKNILWQIK